MTRNGWGSAPGDNRNCSRDAAPHGGSSGGLPWKVTVLALVVCLALAACSSSQGVSGQTPVNSATSGPRITVDMVTHGQAFDPFWALVQEGRTDGGDSLQRQPRLPLPSTTNPQAQASLITKAIARHPKGLVVTIPDAAVLSGSIKQAVSAGIPVIVMNVGAGVYQNVGALTYVGQDEVAAGQEAAREMADAGVRKALCVIHELQNDRPRPAVRRVRQGAGGGGGSAKDHSRQRSPAELGGERDRERAEGRSRPSTGCSPSASWGSRRPAGRCSRLGKFGTIKLGTFDVSTQDLNAVSNGQALFVVDQQPFLEGYMAVQVTAFEVRYGQHPVGPILTGPSLITKANVAQVQQLYKNTGVPLFNGGYPQ